MTVETATKSNTIEFKDFGLEKLIDIFGDDSKIPELKIGIFGDGNARDDDGKINNATLGAIHEFGHGVPVRSFLRMPLITQMKSELDKSGLLTEQMIKKMIKENGLMEFMRRVGAVADGVIHDAFTTGGFGSWKPSDMDRKDNHQTLVESTSLMKSIHYEVTEK